jgi:hypothetical protein
VYSYSVIGSTIEYVFDDVNIHQSQGVVIQSNTAKFTDSLFRSTAPLTDLIGIILGTCTYKLTNKLPGFNSSVMSPNLSPHSISIDSSSLCM